MACIKLNKAISFGCTGGSAGLAGLYLVNKVDLASQTVAADGVTLNAVTLASGAKAIPVDCYKNGAKIADAMRTLDGAAGMEQTGCFQWFKDTNLKVNHNASLCLHQIVYAVYDGVDNN